MTKQTTAISANQTKLNSYSKGDKLSYCFDGDFTVKEVFKDASGNTRRLVVKRGDTELSLDINDVDLINLV